MDAKSATGGLDEAKDINIKACKLQTELNASLGQQQLTLKELIDTQDKLIQQQNALGELLFLQQDLLAKLNAQNPTTNAPFPRHDIYYPDGSPRHGSREPRPEESRTREPRPEESRTREPRPRQSPPSPGYARFPHAVPAVVTVDADGKPIPFQSNEVSTPEPDTFGY